MKNELIFLLIVSLVVILLPEKEQIKNREIVIMTDYLDRKISLVDVEGDGTVDFAVGPFPSFRQYPTKEEQKYFEEHKKQKTP